MNVPSQEAPWLSFAFDIFHHLEARGILTQFNVTLFGDELTALGKPKRPFPSA